MYYWFDQGGGGLFRGVDRNCLHLCIHSFVRRLSYTRKASLWYVFVISFVPYHRLVKQLIFRLDCVYRSITLLSLFLRACVRAFVCLFVAYHRLAVMAPRHSSPLHEGEPKTYCKIRKYWEIQFTNSLMLGCWFLILLFYEWLLLLLWYYGILRYGSRTSGNEANPIKHRIPQL